MEKKKSGKQKGFAIVNIIAGVIVTIAGIMVMAEGDGAAIIAVALGLALWIVGACVVRKIRNAYDNENYRQPIYIVNIVCFVLSVIILGGSFLVSIIASLF